MYTSSSFFLFSIKRDVLFLVCVFVAPFSETSLFFHKKFCKIFLCFATKKNSLGFLLSLFLFCCASF